MKLIKKILIYSLAHLAMFGALSAEAKWPDWFKDLVSKEDRLQENIGGSFPTPWSGTLPRPILFVHGISSDGYSTWGFAKPNCPQVDKIEWLESGNGIKYTATCKPGVKIQGRTGYGYDPSNIERKISLTSYKLKGKTFFRGTVTNYKEKCPYQMELPCTQPYGGLLPAGIPFDIYNDILSNSHKELGIPTENSAWKNGIALFYEDNSTPAYLAQRYNLNTGYDPNRPGARINHNGLEFYNISKVDVTSTSPLTTDKTSYIHPQDQAKDLLIKLVGVLFEYYPDWQQNPEAMIDLVVHSQGGLVTRSMLQQAPRTNDLAHPLNHINHIITIDTPHLGTALPYMDRGVTSVMKMAHYVLNDIENLDSVKILGVGSMDFLPAEILEPVHVLHENAQHLRYACNLHNPAWEPSVSDVADPLKMESSERLQMCYDEITPYLGSGSDFFQMQAAAELYRRNKERCDSKHRAMVDSLYLGSDTNCSTYITELQKAGYPKAPNGRLIPMTAMYGRLNPEGILGLLEIAKDKGEEKCTTTKTAFTLGDCKKKIRRLVNGVIDITRAGLGEEWVAHSDFAVDVSSQVGLGLFDESKHPFRKVEIAPIDPDIGVFHMNMSGLEEATGQKLRGAAWHGEEIFKALQNKPKAKIDMTAPYLLLLQN